MQKNNSKIQNLYFSDQITRAMSGIFDYPLTVVEAPMGYGKTTAVREFLEKSDATVLWQRIFDDSIDGFWNEFCQQICELDYSISQSLLQLGFPDDSVSIHETIKLLSELEIEKETILVIDDYHLITGFDANRFITSLIMSETLDLRIVLPLRFIESSSIAELSLKGYLHHIPKEAFELNASDIKKYYKSCGIKLKDADAEYLHSYSEGWISALYLLMINYKAEGGFETTGNIYLLVEKAIYEPFSDDVKDFLLRVCIFSSFSLEQAKYLWGKDGASDFIAEVTSKNAFITYDRKSKTYQVHTIFTNFLQEIFNDKDIDFKKTIYRKAAGWYGRTGNYLTAMHFFYLAGDFENLLESLELDKGISIRYEQKDLIIKYFSECPSAIKERHPISLLVYALSLMTFNEMALFESVCNEFAELMQRDTVDSKTARMLMGEFELLLSFADYNDISKMVGHVKKAGQLLQEPAVFIDTKGSWTFGSPSVLYMFYRESGQLEKEVQELEDAMPYYCQLTNNHGMGAEWVMAGERYFLQGDFENAEISLHKALFLSNYHNQPEIVISARFLKARLSLLKGDYRTLLDELEQMHKEMEQKKVHTLIHTIDMCSGFFYAYLNQESKIPLWLTNGSFDSPRLLFPAVSFSNIVYGRILLNQGEYLKLLGISEQLTNIASVFPNLLANIYITIYIAAANQKISRRSEALENLKSALLLALPDKVYLPFAENIDFIRPLLEELKRQNFHREEILKILELSEIYKISTAKIQKENFISVRPTLTEREFQVARLAADGFSNKEIGENLFISQNTVKTQLKRVFDKLDLNSRILLKKYFEENY